MFILPGSFEARFVLRETAAVLNNLDSPFFLRHIEILVHLLLVTPIPGRNECFISDLVQCKGSILTEIHLRRYYRPVLYIGEFDGSIHSRQMWRDHIILRIPK
ncbi:hypothetical protein BD410DRAFT_582292 [Rickenella mellea]|uniref:Uncharacterized protein n=1 Tax=Rickenella mellea TaxID=50990 RepID=A0A4Y7PRC4_9AGAM|nr:hypothetical protein BD410DRAFT_582292 [Rickenella mellea]